MVEGAGAEIAVAFGGGVVPEMTAVAALAYLMFNLFSPPCFAALGAMNAEIKDRKWFWGGIALQLATGYSVGYLVYTIGTLIVAPASLNIVAAIGGGAFVLVFAAVLAFLCINSDKKLKAEYALSGKK
jgi:ferrous iron transport protein B